MVLLMLGMFASVPIMLFGVEVLRQPDRYDTFFALGASIFSYIFLIGMTAVCFAYGQTKLDDKDWGIK